MRWTRQRQAREDVRRAVIRERTRRARRTALIAYGKTVWSWHPWLMSSCRWRSPIQPDRSSHQAGSDGGKRNSSPGRARHKPSNHCAGNAGVLRLYLYARVRILRTSLHTRPRVQQAPGIPCSLRHEGKRFVQSLGRKLRREKVEVMFANCDANKFDMRQKRRTSVTQPAAPHASFFGTYFPSTHL